MKSWQIILCLVIVIMGAITCETQKILTRNEMVEYIEEQNRLLQEAEKALKQKEKNEAMLRLNPFCADRKDAVDEKLVNIQQVMKKESDVRKEYEFSEIPLDIGFCLLVRLVDLSFHASYTFEFEKLKIDMQYPFSIYNSFFIVGHSNHHIYNIHQLQYVFEESTVVFFFKIYDQDVGN